MGDIHGVAIGSLVSWMIDDTVMCDFGIVVSVSSPNIVVRWSLGYDRVYDVWRSGELIYKYLRIEVL